MKNDSAYLKHIRDSIKNIRDFVDDADFEGFSKNKMMVSAVVREFEIIGEAASNLSDEFRQSHMEIPWRDMIDMRNVLIHEYFGVIIETVWKTIEKDLPELESMINKILH